MEKKVLIEKVYERENNGIVPTMIKFQNGKLVAFTRDSFDFCRLKHRDVGKPLAAQLVVNGLKYEGLINDSLADELTDTYICVRNKNTNTMKIIPIDRVQMKSGVYKELAQNKQTTVLDNNAQKALFKKFASRKTIRSMNESEMKLRMNVSIMEDDLQANVDNTILPTITTNINDLDSIRPPYNQDTDCIDDVYNVVDIMSKSLLNSMEEDAKIVYQTDTQVLPIKSSYLLEKIVDIQKNLPGNMVFEQLKIIIFMDCLLNVIHADVKSLKNIELSQVSEKIEKYVRKNFSDSELTLRYCNSLFPYEKALCHFIVMAILLHPKREVDADILSKELRITREKLLMYANVVYVLPKSRGNMLTLHLPKTVTPLKAMSFRKKKARF